MKHKVNASIETINFAIDNYIVGFKAYRNREILRRRLIDGLTFEELAEEFSMSDTQIKNIVYANLALISPHLG